MMRLHRALGLLSLAALVVSHFFPELADKLGLLPHGVVLAALGSFSGAGSYDLGSPTQGANLDLSQELSAILLADTMFLGRIGSGGMAKNVDHYWVEETLNATYVSLTAAAASGDATITVDSTTLVPIGALLVNQSEAGVDEVLQVTAVNSATQLAVNRAVGDSGPAASAHKSGSQLRVIAQAKPEGDESVTDISKARSRVHNVCQIFKREVFISGTQQAVDMAGVPNEYQHQLGRRMLEIKRELAMSVWAGVKITAGGTGGSDSVYRSMNGVRNFVRAQSAQVDSVSTAFGEPLVNALYKKIYDQGGEASVAVGSAAQMTQFSQLHRDKIRLSPSDRARGTFVTKYLTEYGVELDLLIDRWCLPGDLMLADPGRVRLTPLQGRQFQATPLDKRGDALRGMIVGEYTLEVRNAGQCFALATSLAIPAA